ncbi:uncharacterized protein At2g29880-like [Macadamia integrifolia]|uniref:uncharacterized protein At2g29880-like n=1 Tax=Macadamia integrifolia TaxID=60698 RepID=UPI001C4F56A9|nr:uncharacterized protein At2g29880-like [Macadamia integrifolia]
MANNQVAANWTQAETYEFVKLMIDNVKKGNKTNSTFSKNGWTNIKERLESVVSRTFTREQLRNKMNKMRTDYRNFKKLLETAGFKWNPITKTATTDDTVWANALQTNPGWTKFKKNGLPHWPKLQVIFGDSYARGDRETNQDEEDFGETQMNKDPQTPLNMNLEDIEVDLEMTNPSKHRLDRNPTGCRKKISTTNVNHVMKNLDKFCSWRMKLGANPEITFVGRTNQPCGSAIAGGSINQHTTINHSVVSCQALLDSIPDLPQDVYFKAVERMWDDPNWRMSFCATLPERRKWFIDHLTAESSDNQ